MKKSKQKILATILTCTFALTTVETILPNVSMIVYGAEASSETASISEILKNQLPDGGWRKNYSTTKGDWSKSTIDNGATYTEIRKLAKEYSKTKDSRYSAAVIKGINCLLDMQYSNGGWPQVRGGSSYHTAITYNDNAMINVMYLLDEVANKSGDFSFVDTTLANKCKNAVDKGVQCILKTQVVVDGELTVWGQQHDKDTLKPTSARVYEVASLCSSESASIVKFLSTRKPTTEINNAIKGAVKWFKKTRITGIEVVKSNGDTVVKNNSNSKKVYWARFYDLKNTNQPIFVGRDGIIKYKLSDIDKERRNGYAWYGSWGQSVENITIKNTDSNSVNQTNNNNNNNNNNNESIDKETSSTISEGVYMIKNINSGKYLDVKDGKAANNVNIQQWGAKSSSPYNSFKIVSAGNGYYKFYSQVGNGKTYVLDVHAKKNKNGANIGIYKDNNGSNQLFKISRNSDGTYAILSKISNDEKGLDVSGSSKSSGANIQQYKYSGKSNQKWILEKVK